MKRRRGKPDRESGNEITNGGETDTLTDQQTEYKTVGKKVQIARKINYGGLKKGRRKTDRRTDRQRDVIYKAVFEVICSEERYDGMKGEGTETA